ncbi:hypothetical protein DNU06_05430 [Putridiphycobacter roseus]|uniref:Phospholipid/glycerol acyltransferase domain-containing protein n=1 Tax=Putridiphycobacter roseus TaxID=2219161 RepID=A0A2W1N0I5_9FLAO|nr:1-acyl-sn-glycerol-3-phosphate acyltransferase [Putridiphycobacter roseus]PZE18059.1 hypothetical protein DNU06_05430 [Putridiphycobacter roseus]
MQQKLKENSVIAAAEWFGNGIKNWIFRSQFNMIPVFRPWIEKSKKKSNHRMFEACTKSLNEGKRILIFPEGTSVTCSYIRELKTGTARMKLDYEGHPASKEPLLIIPIGVNYSHPNEFYGSVTIKVGKPIDFDSIDVEGASKDELLSLSKSMTDKIQEGMESTIVSIKPGEDKVLFEAVIALWESPSFETKQKIAYKIANQKNNQDFLAFKKDLASFQNDLKNYGLSAQFDRPFSYFKKLSILLLLSPFYLLFILAFALPFLFSKFIFNRYLADKIDTAYESEKLNPSFKGTLIFLSGMGIFMLWMIIAYLAIGVWSQAWGYGLLLFILAFPIIKIGLFIHHELLDFIPRLKDEKIKKNYSAALEKLSLKKKKLISFVESLLSQ